MSTSIYIHLVLFLSSLASAVFAYFKVPRETPIAIHFNHKFEPDSWMNPFPGLFIIPALGLLLAVVYYLVTTHNAREDVVSSGNTFMVISVVVHLLMLGAQLYIVSRALGH